MRRLIGVAVVALIGACGCASPGEHQQAAPPRPEPASEPSPLVRPEELGRLEGQDRADWQQPERIMDALGVFDGANVADLGAGSGWFTLWLARRVGPNGRVYAEDIDPKMIESIARRVEHEGLTNVETVLGTPADPRLPPNALHAIVMVDLFQYLQRGDPVGLLRSVGLALAPHGRLGIVDFKSDGLGPGPALADRIAPEVIIRDATAAGFTLASRENFLRYQYLLVFEK